jgi:ABC-2 type transport system ATP-binding protein
MSAAIETAALTRRFGDFTAVREVALRVEAGQFYGFLGPNGAGKSTTIKMLTGLLAPTSGSIRILGEDLTRNSAELKRQIGVVPEGMALFGRLTAREYLRFVGRMYGLDQETTLNRTDELLEFMNLANEGKKLVTDFSHGMQKKLALAAAVIHGPRVLFLDEPFEGVDAVAAGTLKAMLQRMTSHGVTIFLTSHVLEIVERLCTHVGIIHRGELVAQGSLVELRSGMLRAAAPPRPGQEETDAVDPQHTRSLEQVFLEIVGTDRNGNAGAHAPEELSWLG